MNKGETMEMGCCDKCSNMTTEIYEFDCGVCEHTLCKDCYDEVESQ
jgi:hypothetical protein